MPNYFKNIIKGFAIVFTFGMFIDSKKARSGHISSYWFKTGDYINNAYKVETSK